MKSKIKICIVGLGNCASSLVQGLYYYSCRDENKYIPPGLMHWNIGNYKISDIIPVAAFDIDKRKVGKELTRAIFSTNDTKILDEDELFLGDDMPNVEVMKGPVLDGVASHMKGYFQIYDNQKELTKDEIMEVLNETGTEIIINYLPVGSQKATEFWANIALESGCAFINCIPVFIASDSKWADKFKKARLPVIGDDIKSQVGATIVNRVLIQMLVDRGAKIDNSYQLNIGGNTDFLNMLDRDRLESKKISKTESISSLIPDNSNYIYAGPNGYIECLKDNKICHLRIDFRIFGNIPGSIDLKLSVEDSPNSAGCVIDCIRTAKIAIDRKIGGPLIGPSAFYMKHPIQQLKDDIAYRSVTNFISQQLPPDGDSSSHEGG